MKKRYSILASKGSFPSAKILRDVIKEKSGITFRLTATPEKLKEVHVRYGNSFGEFDNDTILNTPTFIRTMSFKKEFADMLLENNLYAPLFSRNIDEIKDYPIVVRTSLSQSKGKGIYIVENQEQLLDIWRSNYYWTKWINLEYELRVHIINGKPVKVFRKCWHKEEDESKFPIRTNEYYNFILQNTEDKYKKLFESIEKITDILGPDNFYSLDIGWDKSKKEYFILEGNSAPGLNELTANLYADFILERLGI